MARYCGLTPMMTLSVIIIFGLFFFMYNLTLRSILVVDVRTKDDLLSALKLQDEVVERIARKVTLRDCNNDIEVNAKPDRTVVEMNEESQVIKPPQSPNHKVQQSEEDSHEGQENKDNKHHGIIKRSIGDKTGDGETSIEGKDIVPLRLLLLKDALNKLESMTKGLYINETRYNNITSSKDTETLCKYYNEEVKFIPWFIPRIWQDTAFYYKEDVTLVTQLTMHKLGTLNELLKHWTGPISCALYLDKLEMKKLHWFMSKYPSILARENLDVHIVFKNTMLYHINYLRNLALNYSYTDYSLLMDVDFMPSNGLSEYLNDIIPTRKYLQNEVLVIPAMEFTSVAGIDFPSSKTELLELWSLKIVDSSVEHHWQPGHKPTNYTKWRNATLLYRVKYEEGYEPYIVGRRDLLPQYNISFIAGFRDKIVHILHVHALGLNFTVIPDHFAVHIPHTREDRPPFYHCSMTLYHDFRNMLIAKGLIKDMDMITQPPSTQLQSGDSKLLPTQQGQADTNLAADGSQTVKPTPQRRIRAIRRVYRIVHKKKSSVPSTSTTPLSPTPTSTLPPTSTTPLSPTPTSTLHPLAPVPTASKHFNYKKSHNIQSSNGVSINHHN